MTPEREQALSPAEEIQSEKFQHDVRLSEVLDRNDDCNCGTCRMAHGFRLSHAALIASEAEKDRMRQALERLPHSSDCASLDSSECGNEQNQECVWVVAACRTHAPEKFTCDCWKSEALAETPPLPCTACAEKDARIRDLETLKGHKV